MRRLIWVFTIVVATLGGAELLARHEGFGFPLLYRAVPSGYELVPDQRVARLGKRSTINALGTRGPNTSALPTLGVWQIMLLSNSVANGGSQLGLSQ